MAVNGVANGVGINSEAYSGTLIDSQRSIKTDGMPQVHQQGTSINAHEYGPSQSQQAPAPAPASGGAQTTATNTSGYAKDPVDEVKQTKEYKDLKFETDALQDSLDSNAFFWLEEAYARNGASAGDGIIHIDEILWAADQVCGDRNTDPSVQNFARFLAQHRELFSRIDANGDRMISRQEVTSFIAAGKAKMKELEDAARGKPSVNLDRAASSNQSDQVPATGTSGSGATGATGAGGTNGPTEGDRVAAEIKAGEAPRPPPSKLGGLEGASENMSNMLGWAEGEFDRLTALMGKASDPGAQKMIEQKLNQLSRLMQALTAMQNQIMTMMSNLSKMYSDIAMNAIRNMR